MFAVEEHHTFGPWPPGELAEALHDRVLPARDPLHLSGDCTCSLLVSRREPKPENRRGRQESGRETNRRKGEDESTKEKGLRDKKTKVFSLSPFLLLFHLLPLS